MNETSSREAGQRLPSQTGDRQWWRGERGLLKVREWKKGEWQTQWGQDEGKGMTESWGRNCKEESVRGGREDREAIYRIKISVELLGITLLTEQGRKQGAIIAANAYCVHTICQALFCWSCVRCVKLINLKNSPQRVDTIITHLYSE